MVVSGMASSQAAEQIQLKAGPLRSTFSLKELEYFADTGQVSPGLGWYGGLLTPDLQQALNNRLDLDPGLGQRFIQDGLSSPYGERFLDSLTTLLPNLQVEQIQTAVQTAADQPAGLSLLSLLRALPQTTLEVDVPAVLALAARLHLAHLETQTLSRILAQSLSVDVAAREPATPDPAVVGPQRVQQRTLIFYDAERRRSIPLDIYWGTARAAAAQPGPLVVLSHGFGADRRFLAYLAEHLASHGLTVVAIEHPGSNAQSLTQVSPAALDPTQPSRILPATEFIDRPRDVSYVLDRLAWLNRIPTVFQGKLKTDQVVFIGHSLGGYTGLALAGARLDLGALREYCQGLQPVGIAPADWLQCAAVELPAAEVDLSDPRIVQVLAMNPLIGRLFGDQGLQSVKAPVVVLTGTEDRVAPTLTQQLEAFSHLPGRKSLMVVVGGTHLSVGDPDNINPALTQIPFMRELQGAPAAALHQYLKGVSLSLALQQTPAARQYQAFLEPAYAQAYSTAALPLRLTHHLPGHLLGWLRGQSVNPLEARSGWQTTVSWLHLSALDGQQPIVAYLRRPQISVTVVQWPLRFLLF
jgi:predicted dienelactone hydrolase